MKFHIKEVLFRVCVGKSSLLGGFPFSILCLLKVAAVLYDYRKAK